MMDYDSIKDKVLASSGRRLTTGMFFETYREDSECKPSFSLKDWQREYVSIADPTEYKAAMALLGDWEHWVVLRNNPILKPIMDKWAKEVEVKLRSDAIHSLVKSSKNEKGQASAKWLAEAGFRIDAEKRDGRVKKDKTDEEAVKKEITSRVKDDMERLGLKVVGGEA